MGKSTHFFGQPVLGRVYSHFRGHNPLKRLKNARNAMFHKFHSQINILFLADSRKKSTKGGLSSGKSCEYGGKNRFSGQ